MIFIYPAVLSRHAWCECSLLHADYISKSFFFMLVVEPQHLPISGVCLLESFCDDEIRYDDSFLTRACRIESNNTLVPNDKSAMPKNQYTKGLFTVVKWARQTNQ